ncbi:ankyrin repeat-containing domain protein [Cytidiella melzeri]|nr:ankyrin repeat-containing domain protein [Cytidiella melzeri]
MAEKDATVRLRRAVQENNLFLVKRLIKRTGDMRNPDPANKRYTSLALAAILGNEETFEYLLGIGHDDDEISRDSEDSTVLILLAEAKPPVAASCCGGSIDQEFYGATLRMARLYNDRYPETLDWANADGKTALHIASQRGNEELVRMLLSLGADFDLPDNEGNTALHYGSAWGHIPVVQLLIERGCQYNVRNNDGFTPSDYAYSTSTKDVLQDTARAQFELNKKSRRNVFAQAAARGNEWGAVGSVMPPPLPPKLSSSSIPRLTDSSLRMRSGSGASRTTETSDSGEWNDNYATGGHSRTLTPSATSSLSPPRSGIPLPSGASLAQTNLTSAQSVRDGLSPIASRMRERDAEAMEKYKLRQRSGSAATASTDAPSQSGSGISSNGPSEDELTSLKRRLRPSASAAQLRSPSQPPVLLNPQAPTLSENRSRNGSSPGILKRHPSLSSASSLTTGKNSTPTTPTQPFPPPRTSSSRPSISTESSRDKEYTGPSTEYAKFPPPPEPVAEKTQTTTPTATYTRRIPFFSHKQSSDREHHGFAHKRNSSSNSLAPRVT